MSEPAAAPRSARGYSWPPFEPGNLKAVHHGARSERLVNARSAEIAAELFAECPWMADVDGEAVERYCRAEARARMLHAWIERQVEEKGPAGVKPYVWTEAGRADANAQKFGQDLGLDPTGRAKVLRDLGWAKQLHRGRLDELQSRGRALRRGDDDD